MSTAQQVLEAALNEAMSVLRHSPEAELQALVNDEAKLDALINGLQQTDKVARDKEALLTNNKSLAEWNLGREPILRDGKQRLRDTYEQAAALKQQLDELKRQYETATQQRSLDSSLSVLQAAAQEAEDDSEKVAESFLSGDLDVDKFIDQFTPKRTLAHQRKVKAEKLAELIRSQQLATSPQAQRAAPAPPTAVQSQLPSYWNQPQTNPYR